MIVNDPVNRKITEKARKLNSDVLTFWITFASFTAIFVINIAVFTFYFAHLLAGYKKTGRYYKKGIIEK